MLPMHGNGKMAMKPANLILLTLLISVVTIDTLPFISYGQPVEGRVRNLNTGATYDAIQEAINAANTGDTIFVSNGTYYEHVILNKTVTLRVENKSNTIIDGEGSGNVISVSVDAASISGFTIQNSGSTHPNAGVYVDDSENTGISNNIIQRNAHGIYLYSSDGNSVSDNTISGNYFFGVDVFSASNNVVSNNNITGNSNGIRLSQSINNFISDNNVSQSIFNAIEITACVDNSFSGNSLSNNNNNGFYVEISTGNHFSRNNVSKNQQGFYLITSSDNRIYGNHVSSNANGVWLSGSFNNIFLGNYFINNQNSLNLITSNNNAIYHNNFINTIANTTQKPNVVGSVNSWDKESEGNYWSNHVGSDKNNDGITETPYVIDGENIDNYPLTANYTEFNITVGVRSFMVSIVSNSTISSFEYFYYPANRTAVVSFQVNNTGGKGFCRISVPHVLIAPPFTVVMNYNASLSADIVHSNRTHSWLFFTYDHTEGPSIILLLSQEQTAMWQFWFWTTMVLVAAVMVQFLLVTKYRQIADEQKEVIRAYELKIQMYAREHLDTARRLFEVDVQRRKTKIEKFESKYNVRLRPSNSFEGIIKSMELKKKEGKEEKRS